MEIDPQTLSAEFLKRLHAFVRGWVRTDADADDVVQDVLTKLVQHGAPAPASVHAWLFTVARHVLIDRSRTRRPLVGLPAVDLAEEPSEPSGEVSRELARCLEPMMAALSDDDRLVLTRIDLRGESQVELARELSISNSGIKSRVQRARKRLRAVLENCCSVEQDRRGNPIDYEKRSRSNCACSGTNSAC
jgi:RNA polymerase sigma-70 factor (ECF subfamily)